MNRGERGLGESSNDSVLTGGATAAGAVLGGLLLGPFGAIFGAQLGSRAGSRALSSASSPRSPLSSCLPPATLDAARGVAEDLGRAEEAEVLVRDAVGTLQELARRRDEEQRGLADEARALLAAGDEEGARGALMRRERVKEGLVKALKGAKGERERLRKMEDNVAAMKVRAVEVENAIKRIAAESLTNDLDGGAGGAFELEVTDPLLDKFKKLEENMKGDE
ncbi:hypothetical protein TrRE_jg4868 [Triparma retinervis]|uniref:Uncharacterized protein n=1 Tax=Triparma retinervis TaxID=2557542 RepID=A0A9W7E1M2_9STRA|nr:hypothetical protein TrRE_jg4868 [Triparma retinervis]